MMGLKSMQKKKQTKTKHNPWLSGQPYIQHTDTQKNWNIEIEVRNMIEKKFEF